MRNVCNHIQLDSCKANHNQFHTYLYHIEEAVSYVVDKNYWCRLNPNHKLLDWFLTSNLKFSPNHRKNFDP